MKLLQTPLLEERKKAMTNRFLKADQLLERYSKITWTGGKKNIRLAEKNRGKARRMALSLSQQERYLKSLNETTISTEFGTTPENVMRIVRTGAANRNRGEFFTEWPMTTTDDAVYFIDRVYKSTLRGATAGQVIGENIHSNYGSSFDEQSVGTGNGILTTFAAVLATNPLVPYGVQVMVAGKLIASDDGAGKFVSEALNLTTSTINYSTGAINLVFLAAPATGAEIIVEYRWDTEVSSNYDQYGHVTLQVRKKRFDARIHPIGYSFTSLTRLTLETSGLGSIDDQLILTIGDLHSSRSDYKAIQQGRRVALQNPVTVFDADYAAAGADSDQAHNETIKRTINNVGKAIYNDIKRGGVTAIVAAGGFVNYIANVKGAWVPDLTQRRVEGTFLAGKFDGIPVYQCPADVATLADNEALLIYKNPDEVGDVGIAFGTLTEIDAGLEYPEFYKTGNIGVVEDMLVINGKFIRLMSVENLPT